MKTRNGAGDTIADDIARFLRTGETDPLYRAWPGDTLDRCRRGTLELRTALIREVALRSGGRKPVARLQEDTFALCREKVTPMVRGLFPRSEREAVLTLLEKSTVFVTRENLESILLTVAWDRSAWTIANLYLASVEAELLAPDAPRIVGLNENTTCYVSLEYFDDGNSPFADFLVHEAAHVFHNCKRRSAGLRETGRREWLLDIAFGERENFAYSCEAYACILRSSNSPARRGMLARDFAREFAASDDRVQSSTVASIVQEAAAARNGWKTILARCAAP